MRVRSRQFSSHVTREPPPIRGEKVQGRVSRRLPACERLPSTVGLLRACMRTGTGTRLAWHHKPPAAM